MARPLERRGSFTVSIDVELGWGVWDRPCAAFLARTRDQERVIVDRLLGLFGRYQIEATWAIVGALLEPAQADGRPGHPSCWTAPELIGAIGDLSPKQDVGSHGFGHVDYADIAAAAGAVDLERAREVHAAAGLGWGSFVFPRNRVGHLDLLAAAGIKVFRGRDPDLSEWVERKIGRTPARAANLLAKALPGSPPVVRPRIVGDGLVELPGSMLWMSHTGPRRLIRPGVTQGKCVRALRLAAERRSTFHLWFHPSNFYWDTDRQLRSLESVLRRATDLRDRDELDILPLAAYGTLAEASHFGGTEPTALCLADGPL